MLTRTSELAVRTLLYLAQTRSAEPLSPRQLAGPLDCSPSYLSKTLGLLVRAGVLRSVRGSQGGVILSRSPHRITLLEIVQACQGLLTANYCDGNGREGICSFHKAMRELHEAMVGLLERWTLQDLLESPSRPPRSGKPPCKMHFKDF